MTSTSLIKRRNRIAMRKKSISQDVCPNCNIKLRERWHGGMYCSKCNWEKQNN